MADYNRKEVSKTRTITAIEEHYDTGATECHLTFTQSLYSFSFIESHL